LPSRVNPQPVREASIKKAKEEAEGYREQLIITSLLTTTEEFTIWEVWD
jgi:hypothetical protein